MNIIATTADQIDKELFTRCKNSGFDDIISKPVLKVVLRKIINEYY